MNALTLLTGLTVTAKAQIKPKRDFLRHLGTQPGEQIEAGQLPGGEMRIQAGRDERKLSDIFGLIERDGRKPASIEVVNEAIDK